MYNKLFTQILDSSIWLESDQTVRVWVTLLAAMDEDGYAKFAAVGNLAARARVSIPSCTKAVGILEGPDQNSSDPDNEGRRIERVPGGWMVLNAAKYRDLGSSANYREKTRKRVAAYRERKRNNGSNVTCNAGNVTCNAHVTPSETETETEAGIHTTLEQTIVEPKPSTRTPPSSPEADRIFEYWKTTLKHPQAIFTSKRRKLVAERLKEGYSVAQLIEAIDGCAMSPFHQGENKDGTIFDDLELICRSGEKVEQFIGFIASSQGRPNGEILRRTAPRRESETERRIRQTVESINTPPEGADADRPAIAAMPRSAGS